MDLFRIVERLKSLSWQWVMENPRRLGASLNRMSLIVLGRYSKGWSIVTLVIARKLYRLYRTNGMRFVSQYLSTCQISLMKFMSEMPDCEKLHLTTTRCSLSPCGLPRIIPSSHRKILRRRDSESKSLCRVYLTIFGLSRLYKLSRRHPDIRPITDRISVDSTISKPWASFRASLKRSLPELLFSNFSLTREIELGLDWVPSWSSGPATTPLKEKTNVIGLGIDAFPYMESFKRNIFSKTKQERDRFSESVNYLWSVSSRAIHCLGCFWYAKRIHIVGTKLTPAHTNAFRFFTRSAVPFDQDTFFETFKDQGLGRLGRKYEGGGKVRVFTMADSVRQSCFRPIHNYIMDILRQIPQDGTFHQLRPLKKLTKLVKFKGPMFCFDLSSATDRFPVVVQRDLLEWFFGGEAADSWLDLMKNHPFLVPWKKELGKTKQVHFRVGQPLGVYSSWPVFALTHHLLIQHCADATVSGKWFNKYALLGDDIVIADREVASRYRELISQLGVNVSLKKTLTSEKCCIEFAKRFILDKDDLSPISFKSVYSIIPQTVGALVDRIREFRTVRRSEPYRWLGAGFRILAKSLYPKRTGKRWKRYHLILTNPKGPFALPPLWWHSFYAPRPVTERDVAVVRCALLAKTELTFNPSLGSFAKYTAEDVLESIVYGKWLLTYYRLIKAFIIELIETNDLTPWYNRPTMAQRPQRVKRLQLMRYGVMFRCWEAVLRVTRKPNLLCITS